MEILDIAHVFFLENIKTSKKTMGAPVATGELIRKAMDVAKRSPSVEYSSMDEFDQAVKDKTNPLTLMEGEAVLQEGNIYGLPECPFAASIKSYIGLFGALPGDYKEMADDCNKTSSIKDKLHIGEGACVSPFCAIHQTLRSSLVSNNIKIAGKDVVAYQLGCKSASGAKGFADKWIKETGASKDTVDKILDDSMCCYLVKPVE